MNNQRAKDIISSPVMINVTYNSLPVYIETIDVHNDIAKIHLIYQPDNKQEVSINNLVEQ